MNTSQSNEDKELRNNLIELYSANFNDGESVDDRYGSKDMIHISVMVDYIDDFLVPYVTESIGQAEIRARIDERLIPRNYHIDINYSGHHQDGFRMALDQVSDADKLRISELEQQLSLNEERKDE